MADYDAKATSEMLNREIIFEELRNVNLWFDIWYLQLKVRTTRSRKRKKEP